MIDVLIVVTVAVHALLIGMLIGQRRERNWQRRQRESEEELERYQREMNKILQGEYVSTQEVESYFSDRVH